MPTIELLDDRAVSENDSNQNKEKKMKNTIYAEEFGTGLTVEANGPMLRVVIVRLGNSPNETEEIASVTIAGYRVKNELLPVVESVEN